MTTNSKTNMLEHSAAKVKLLKEYINRYLNIIGNDQYTDRIDIYDLFCGEGLYDDGGEGSPLVIMRAISELHSKNVANISTIPRIHIQFNDLNEEKVEKVKKSLGDLNLINIDSVSTNFTSIDYKSILKTLPTELDKLTNQKAFIFIDPYEYKHIKIGHIKELMRNKKTEVLLWLPTQFMYRFERNGTPQALKDFIDELLPEYKDWRHSKNGHEFVEELRIAFQENMGSDYFVDNFSIRKDKNTMFSLYFFTSHIKGYEVMLDSKWNIDKEQGKGWEYSNIGQLNLFSNIGTTNNELSETLKAFLKEKHRTNGELYLFTLNNGFLPKHINEILKDWQSNNEIRIITSSGKDARKGSFYISYSNYKNNPSKVTIHLK